MKKSEYNNLSDSEKAKEDWMNSKWRPMCGWVYIVVCIVDFIIFPILWSLLQAYSKGQVTIQWQPITLQGAGLFHMSMGVILGVSAYGRTQEKLNGANNGGLQLPTTGGSTYMPTWPIEQSSTSNVDIPTAAPVWQYGEPTTYSRRGESPTQTFISKNGKVGPILYEPEL